MKSIFRLALFVIASVSLATAQGTYTQIDYPGALRTVCTGIDTSGDIVGYYVDANANYHGFLLIGGNYQTIDYPGATLTYLFGLNDNGQIVGYAANGNPGFLYDLGTQTFTSVTSPLGSQTQPTGINNSGTIAGTFFYANGPKSKFVGFELVGSRYYDIFASNTGDTFVVGVTTAGKALGFTVSSSSFPPFFYYRGVYKPLSLPLGATVNGVNPEGTAIVGYYKPSTGVTAGFLQQMGLFQELLFPGSSYTMAHGINASGQVVGEFDDATAGHGFLWTLPAGVAPK